ncbi:MAG: magnesium/cobalt transporter CorA [Cyclobacteriaceae bacterium]|nr:magnesium/cobalt transporter CorA [Cyclobacteriaceae bacterium]MCB0499325.1 magnesium/cobalt transporter CorA [Cyclobacteriaceae bacterium]MCB9236403.1 magnesium/cobalt transporter CorA [Flammeovirgaceae bacterium]MCO5272278.1 magnesium/cobalt transporter CorA [Cyclobacteriaceae bacterium]MCW5902136.1 magnesium/cobalt transporter CorA [Cyclobacteriaceae bacterium]
MKGKILDTIKKPDKIILQGLKSLTHITGSITGIDFNFYSKIKSEAKGKSELTFIGKKKMEEVKLQLFTYNETTCNEATSIGDFNKIDKNNPSHNYWLNLHGIHDVALIEDIGRYLALERLTIRQLVDTTQRPKVDDYEDYVFFSIKSILMDESRHLKIEQLSFVLGKNYVLSFQEEAGDHFEHIRNKLRENLGLIRKRECDFLLFQLLDAILDNYFETLDQINHEVAIVEKETMLNPEQATLLLIEKNKKNVGKIKKSLLPFKEALTNIIKDRTHFINRKHRKYFRDLKNSCANAIEEANATYAALESLTNIYFSSLSQKMNETMKVLTTVATIFIPLTFIAGIYGMNFANMPELKWKYGYYVIWGIMLTVLAGMVIYFKRKKWL